MLELILACAVIIPISVVMAMVGRGGGNFYVPALLILGFSVYQAATSAQLVLVLTAAAALIIFQKNRTVDWKLALVIDPPTDIMAFVGGFYAHSLGSTNTKILLVALLLLSGFLMLRRPVGHREFTGRGPGYWHRKYGEYEYTVNLWVAIPITAVTGLMAGIVGISGGSFKIPLMVLACGVPMRIAIGTSSAMVAATALMGFLGHAIGGDFDPYLAIPLGAAAVAGGLLGGRFSLKADPGKLRSLFACSTLLAALLVALGILM